MNMFHGWSKVCLGLFLTWAMGASAAEPPIRWGHGWWYDSAATTHLKTSGEQIAHIFVPTQNMTISEVWVCTGPGQVGIPIFHVGIQGNGENGFPDGNWVGGASNYSVSTLPVDSAWNQVVLPGPAEVEAGISYHIVVEVISADDSNKSSIRFLNQRGVPVPFRPESGVYDTRIGREVRSAAGVWSLSGSAPLVAVDTNFPLAIGQPYQSATPRSVYGTTRYGQFFTLDVPSQFNRFYLRKLGMKLNSSGTAEDDCLIKLRRVSDNALLVSETLVEKTVKLDGASPVAFVDVVDLESVILKNGQAYYIYIESTNTTSANAYVIKANCGMFNTVSMLGADTPTFQGTNSYVISSTDELTWYKYNYSSGEVDTAFELELVPISRGSLIVIQ